MGGSTGSRTRGGARRAPAPAPVAPAPVDKKPKPSKAKAPSVATPVATNTATAPKQNRAGLAPIQRGPRIENVQNTITATNTPLKKNKAMQVGGMFGRTASGEWYLGRKKGKG